MDNKNCRNWTDLQSSFWDLLFSCKKLMLGSTDSFFYHYTDGLYYLDGTIAQSTRLVFQLQASLWTLTLIMKINILNLVWTSWYFAARTFVTWLVNTKDLCLNFFHGDVCLNCFRTFVPENSDKCALFLLDWASPDIFLFSFKVGRVINNWLLELMVQITGLEFSSIDPNYIYVQGVDHEVILEFWIVYLRSE